MTQAADFGHRMVGGIPPRTTLPCASGSIPVEPSDDPGGCRNLDSEQKMTEYGTALQVFPHVSVAKSYGL
jgi:hypothetical protein